MRSAMRCILSVWACCVALACILSGGAGEPSRTGPATEKRFPPLKLAPGFKATLFVCDPLIEYPSVIAGGPRPGTLFVAVDYMTGLGTDIVRRSEIRLIEDTDGDGYADKAIVYADGFNSIQGLAYHGGTVWVMHAPFLTALRDTNGDGKADERRNLLTGLGLTPEKNPVRLHCANGVVRGHDGWLYLALGDHGCDVKRPEGDHLVLYGGGILRCRPDGRDLHVFATGLRNIYDVALDAGLNVFVRDNENDGGDYKVRVCHSFFGADHGYPYLYYERPDEALPPLADLGLGSSAGGVCYLERQFPAEYRGNLFFCEWGRSVVCYRPRRSGSGFAPLKEQEFAAGADNDPYGFKPTDLVVDRDGALFVSDWADDQRPKRGRGRIYRITHSGTRPTPSRSASGAGELERWISHLDSDSYHERVEAQDAIERRGREGTKALREVLSKKKLGVPGRLHAVWALAHVSEKGAVEGLLDIIQRDPDPGVQAQAVRAVADLVDPVLSRHRLDAPRGDAKLAEQLAASANGKDPRVLLEVVVAIGRLRWGGAPAWLHEVLKKPDATLAHAAMQTLRRSDNWPAVLKLADQPDADPLRALAVRALADQFVAEVVDGLIERLRTERDPGRRRQYADALTRVCKRSSEWVYWGYRPPPRPANMVAWERTSAIEKALDGVLGDHDPVVRLAVLRRMQREKIPARLATLGRWLREEENAERLAVLVDALREHPAGMTRELLESAIGEKRKPVAGRLAALALFDAGLDETSEQRLLTLARSLEDGPVLAESLRLLSKRPRVKTSRLLLDKLTSSEATVRSAAVEALAALQVPEAAEPVRRLLVDRDAGVRRAAAAAAGRLNVRLAAGVLLRLARDADADTRRASLESLRLLKEPRVVPLAVAALGDETTRHAALLCIADLGGPAQAEAVVDLAQRDPSAAVLPLVLRLLTDWAGRPGAARVELERAGADLQGASGVLARWHIAGPLSPTAAAHLAERLSSKPSEAPKGETPPWRTLFGSGTESRLRPGSATEDGVWLAYSDFRVPERAGVQFLAASSAGLRIWVNGKLAYRRDEARPFRPDSEHFDAVLDKGLNRVIIQLGATKGGSEFHARFRRKGSTAEHEALTRAALTRPGNPERGRKLFFDASKTQCVKCHRIGDQGERIGPELSGVGSRFPRIHLIESILQPSRTIAPGFQTFAVTLKGGRVLTGVRVAEADDTLTFADAQGNKHLLRKSSIEEQQPQAVSVMPEGLEKPLRVDEFVDLIAFLGNLKSDRSR
ncbi:MAG: HEAT repeat domain-containing protein [Planctomycetes bacterium]|nr:HEAT repeat domain-containing protein [Planctomycetota bacterium]